MLYWKVIVNSASLNKVMSAKEECKALKGIHITSSLSPSAWFRMYRLISDSDSPERCWLSSHRRIHSATKGFK